MDRLLVLTLFAGLLSAGSDAFAQRMFPEASGCYSGLFIQRQFQGASMMLDGAHNKVTIKPTDSITEYHLVLMTPGKRFGVGIEAPFTTANNVVSLTQLSLVGKYEFGIYRHYRLFQKERLANIVAAAILKINFPDIGHTRDNPPGTISLFRPGGKSLSTGFVFHTDTKKYFRIHGHLMLKTPITYREIKPGLQYQAGVLLLAARLGFHNIYPIAGLMLMQHAEDKFLGQALPQSKQTTAYASVGFQSTWKYFPATHIFTKFETALQKLIAHNSKLTPAGPDIVFYFGLRFYYR